MQGYVLYGNEDGSIVRVTAEGATKRHVIRALDDMTPEGAEIFGIVLGQADDRFLHLVA